MTGQPVESQGGAIHFVALGFLALVLFAAIWAIRSYTETETLKGRVNELEQRSLDLAQRVRFLEGQAGHKP